MAPPPPGQAFLPPRRDFIGKPAPPGYVAGVGRGATGFTTRSDIGPAREAVAAAFMNDRAGPSSSSADVKPKPGQPGPLKRPNDDDEEEDLNESNYDEFAGYGGSLFSRDPYEEDDEEADKIYAEIDKHIDERGKALREARARQELELFRQKRPKIQQQFIDLKANLKQVSLEEWASIPDVGDARNRKQRVARQDKFTPIPDSLLAHQARLATGGETLVYIEPNATDNPDDTDQDTLNEPDELVDRKPILPDGQKLNMSEVSEYRSSYMSMRLSRAANSAPAHSGADTSGQQQQQTNAHAYLTNLNSMVPNQLTDTTAINEYRKQFAALRASNPTFQNGWIASVRLEEAAGKVKEARKLILAACEHLPKSVDLWLEAVRLNPPDVSKALLVEALKQNPRSVHLWIKAAELEVDNEARRRVYSKAREILPSAPLLWKNSVELEEPEQAKALLKQAVECCPHQPDLWIALARLLDYEEANQVLKEANEKNPKERSIWITAAKLQEQVGKLDLVEKIITLSVTDLISKGVQIDREEWFQEAMDTDRAGFSVTCRELIKRVVSLNVPDEQRLPTWRQDIKNFISKGSLACARAVHEAMIDQKDLKGNESIWLEYANFELQQLRAQSPLSSDGGNALIVRVLEKAVQKAHCPRAETLWLMLAQQTRNNPEKCRRVLNDALEANPDSEKIVLALVELESTNANPDEARRILANACKSAKTPDVVMRSAQLEWSLNNLDEAVRMLRRGVEEYKNCPDFYLSLGKIEAQRGDMNKAKEWYSNGLKFNPTSVELWISMANLEERTGFVAKARSRLEMARVRNPANVRLWLEAAKLEWRQYLKKSDGAQRNRPDMVTTILAKGLKECKDKENVSELHKLQAEVSKRKFG